MLRSEFLQPGGFSGLNTQVFFIQSDIFLPVTKHEWSAAWSENLLLPTKKSFDANRKIGLIE